MQSHRTDLSKFNKYSFTHFANLQSRKFILHFSNECDKITNQFSDLIHVYSASEGANIKFDFEKETNAEIIVLNAIGQTIHKQKVNASNESIIVPLPKNNQIFIIKITTSTATGTYSIFH